MLVRDWMTPDPITVLPDTPVMDALKILRERGFRRLPVMEEGQLVGITTRKDLKDAMPSKATTLSVWELDYLLSKLTVAEMMARPVITATESEYMEDAALRMQEHAVGGLPVLDKMGKLCGIITVTDVLRAFTNIMGLREGGHRLTLDMPDVPGSLERATRAIQPSNIISVATYFKDTDFKDTDFREADLKEIDGAASDFRDGSSRGASGYKEKGQHLSDAGRRRFVMRVTGEGVRDVRARVRAAGIDVLD